MPNNPHTAPNSSQDFLELILNRLDTHEAKLNQKIEDGQKDLNDKVDMMRQEMIYIKTSNERMHDEHQKLNELLADKFAAVDEKHHELEDRIKPVEKDLQERETIKKYMRSNWKKITIIFGILSTAATIAARLSGWF